MDEQRSVRTLICRSAFRHRGSAGAGFLIRQSLGHASRALPIRRVAEAPHVVAFHHPVPGFEPLHLLLVPKLSVPSVMHFTDGQRARMSEEIELLVPEALDRLGLSAAGFLLLANGGSRQDVGQVHFHLLTLGYELAPATATVEHGAWIDCSDPVNDLHQVRVGDQSLLAGLIRAAENRDALQLDRRGYSIIWDARDREAGGVVHLTAGPVTREPLCRGTGRT
jgi:diadenosine tetraphosphate (Ap4A) HIT family hydrolase